MRELYEADGKHLTREAFALGYIEEYAQGWRIELRNGMYLVRSNLVRTIRNGRFKTIQAAREFAEDVSGGIK